MPSYSGRSIYSRGGMTISGRPLWLHVGLVLCLAVSMLPLALAVPTAPPPNATASSGPRLSTQATSDQLNYNGIDQKAVSLVWAQTGDALFVNYTLYWSSGGSNGPWHYFATITNYKQTTYYAIGATPGANYWWVLYDYDAYSSAPSNTLAVTQTPAVSLSASLATPTSAQLSWTNSAQYGGWIGFSSYQISESVNSGPFATLATITNAATTTYVVPSLSSGTNYRFQVVTADNVSQQSVSNTVSISTPAPLSASATASQSSADVGQAVSFTCVAAGGQGPYTYSWSFSDGGSASGATATHAFSSAGSQNAVCSVHDSFGTAATTTSSISIYSAPTVSLTATPSSMLQGESVTLTATPQGGSGGLTYTWDGLPSGCTGANSATITCAPSSVGTFSISVTVTDSNGGTGSSTASITVSSSVGGMPATQGYLVYGGIVAVVIVVVVAVVLALRARGRRRRETNQPPPPPPPSH